MKLEGGTRNGRTPLYALQGRKRADAPRQAGFRDADSPTDPVDKSVGECGDKDQGRTITSTTISDTASAGTSFSIRRCRPVSVGFPAASLRA